MLLRCTDVWYCCFAVYMKGWGWGGGMLPFLVLRPLHVATLHRCLVVLLRCIHEGVRCGRGGMLLFLVLLPLHVAMLHRCLVLLLLCTHEGIWGGVGGGHVYKEQRSSPLKCWQWRYVNLHTCFQPKNTEAPALKKERKKKHVNMPQWNESKTDTKREF